MAKNDPDMVLQDVDSASIGWDALLLANMDILRQGFHFPRYDDVVDLPDPSSHKGLFAPVGTTSAITWYISLNGSWVPAGAGMAADPGDSTAANLADLRTDFNALLALLRTLGILV